MKKYLFFTLLLSTISLVSSCQTNFDKEVWLKNNDFLDTKNPRANMVNDLMHNFLKTGMKKEEVLKLLGEPYSDTIGAFLPKGVKLPDSLLVQNTSNMSKEKIKEYRELSNKWYKKNYQSAPMLTYPIGWSMIDPIFLEIQLNDKNEVVDFWTKEH
jgi:hypothetical protein